MKDFFYLLVVIILIAMYLDIDNYPRHYEVSDFNNSVIIDKSDDFFYGKMFYVKYPNDSIVKIRCYGIVWEKYNVRDTIR